MKNIFIIILTLLSFSAPGQDTNQIGGPPKQEELIGVWKKVNSPKLEAISKTDPWPQQYQWFAFLENGKVYSMMTNQDQDMSAAALLELFSLLPEDKTPNFNYNGQFVFIDSKDMEDYVEMWGVNLFKIDFDDFVKKGDLLMTLDDGEDKGNVIYYRLLRRVE